MKKINFKYFRGYGDTLLGLSTWQWLEPGYVYAPYIPLFVPPGVNLVEYDRTTYMSYEIREVNPNYYRRIVVDTDVQSMYAETITTNMEILERLNQNIPRTIRLSTR